MWQFALNDNERKFFGGTVDIPVLGEPQMMRSRLEDVDSRQSISIPAERSTPRFRSERKG